MNIGITIIIPIYQPNYNYLIDCFNSINPQLDNNDQVICVLNGNNEEINDEIKKYLPTNYDAITLDKGDVSFARNTGISYAKNEYILFVDCDDLIGHKTLKIAKDIIKNNNPDFLTFKDTTSLNDFNKQSDTCHKINKDTFLSIWKGDVQIPTIFLYKSSCNHIYKKSIIVNNHISFNNNQKIAEDTLFNFEYCINANSFLINESIMYYYRQNTEGATTKTNNNAINDIDLLISNYIKILKKYSLEDDYYNYLNKEIIFNYLPYIFKSYIFNKNNCFSISKRKVLIKNISKKPNYSTAIKRLKNNNTTTKKQKILLFLLKMHLYCLISLIYKPKH